MVVAEEEEEEVKVEDGKEHDGKGEQGAVSEKKGWERRARREIRFWGKGCGEHIRQNRLPNNECSVT